MRDLLVQGTSTKQIKVCEVPRSGNPPAMKDDGTTHSKSGGTQTAPGIIYPRLWCMWLLLKLKELDTEFSLKPEYEKAGKFDDIFLHFKDKLADQWINLYIQLKHKDSETIKLESLKDLKKNKFFVPEDIENSLSNLDFSNDEIKNYFMLLTNANIEINFENICSEIISVPCLEAVFPHGKILQIYGLLPNLSLFEEQIVFAVNQYSIEKLEKMIEDCLLKISNGNENIMKIKFSSLQILVQKSIETMNVFNIDNAMFDQHLAECDAIGQIHHNLQEPTTDAIERFEEQEQASNVLFEQKEGSETIDVLISGEDSDGRTELARKIAFNCKEFFDHIICIDGNDPEFDIGEFGKKLNLCIEDSKEAMIDKTYKQLNKFRTLLIYDNTTKDTPMPTGNYSNIYTIVISKFNDRDSKLNIRLYEATFDECVDFVGEKVQQGTENH
ncbi:hypothetical protein B566_EDAN018279, partial [Ephemera danica]